MTIIITIVAILIIIVGLIMWLFKDYMNDVPTPRANWDFQDYVYAAIPFVLIASGIGLLIWF